MSVGRVARLEGLKGAFDRFACLDHPAHEEEDHGHATHRVEECRPFAALLGNTD